MKARACSGCSAWSKPAWPVAPLARCAIPAQLSMLGRSHGLPDLPPLELILARSTKSKRPPCDFLAEQLMEDLQRAGRPPKPDQRVAPNPAAPSAALTFAATVSTSASSVSARTCRCSGATCSLASPLRARRDRQRRAERVAVARRPKARAARPRSPARANRVDLDRDPAAIVDARGRADRRREHFADPRSRRFPTPERPAGRVDPFGVDRPLMPVGQDDRPRSSTSATRTVVTS